MCREWFLRRYVEDVFFIKEYNCKFRRVLWLKVYRMYASSGVTIAAVKTRPCGRVGKMGRCCSGKTKSGLKVLRKVMRKPNRRVQVYNNEC